MKYYYLLLLSVVEASLFAQVPLGVDLQSSIPYGYLGSSMALNAAGDRLAVNGYTRTSSNAIDQYYIEIFDRMDGTWVSTNIISEPISEASYGRSVDLTADGTRLVVGAPGFEGNDQVAPPGYVFAYEKVGSEWEPVGQPIIGYGYQDNEIGNQARITDDGMHLVVDSGIYNGRCIKCGGVSEVRIA